jgi:hypothetical protein
MYAWLDDPGPYNTFIQGEAIHFHGEYAGRISHFHTSVGESCQIRFVLGYIDPPGHNPPMDPYHVVGERYYNASFPPGADGQLIAGSEFSHIVLEDDAGVDWVGTNTAFAKTNYSLNGGAQVNGNYDDTTFTTTP